MFIVQLLRKKLALSWISTDVLLSIDNKADSTSESDKFKVEIIKIGFKLDKSDNGKESELE